MAGDDLWDLQAGHRTHIAGMIYAYKLMEGNNTIIGRQEKFCHSRTKQKRSLVKDKMDEVQAHALEDIYRAGIQFRGLQKPMLEAIIKNKSLVLVVIGTSVGKTMLFQIPAKSMSLGTTVVITPLILLQDHMVKRCQKVGILCTKWKSQHAGKMQAQIVIVMPKAAVSKAFGTFLNDLQGRQELVWIIYDKCYMVMDSTPDFWPKIWQLGELAI
ncbi:hypothetical protein B0J14DRAFT_571422 [Halenospora varia]|nr:hypothetical protein B0J14DRAFT_571422 [Halenospora varia]